MLNNEHTMFVFINNDNSKLNYYKQLKKCYQFWEKTNVYQK